MGTKRDAKCDSKPSYLWLRNNIFYYRVELPRVDGKRRYKRVSLHTSNFYEAREKIKIMENGGNWPFDEIRRLIRNLDFEPDADSNASFSPSDTMGLISTFRKRRKLSRWNNRKNIEDLLSLGSVAEQYTETLLTPKDRELLREFVAMKPMFEEFLKTTNVSLMKTSAPSPKPRHKISDILEAMLLKGNNCEAEQTRKRNTITKLLGVVGLKLEDDYSKFHTVDTIGAISRHVIAQVDMKGDMKRKLLRYIKEFANCGIITDPDNYKANVILNLPKIEKTRKSERNPHKPYTEEQLLEIFNPKHTYFKENPDAYFVCLIALFTGARANSALTLQYDDVLVKDGIDSIYFRENHKIKQLKNEASERIVPIHPQLLEAGFLDYVQQNKKKLNAKGEDFIFPRCQTKGGLYNNKYTVRVLFNFFMQIGVKAKTNDGLDFHSFRKNASLVMQDAGISPSYINDIIGWEGQSTMEQSYSNHTLAQIKDAMSKFSYDFLEPHFAEWKKIFGL